MKLSSRLRRTIGVLASFTLATGAVAIASPAAHALGTLTGPTSANVSQQVNYTLTGPPAGNLVLEDANGQGYAYQTAGLGDPTAYFTFVTATNAQTLNLFVADQNTGAILSNTISLTIGGVVATTTEISAPNTATIGKSITITATVTSASGSQYNPPGQIRITDANNATITIIGLTNGPGAGQSYAYFRWTPKAAGTYFFIATYVPSNGSLATGSTSIQDSVIASPSGNTISISAPPTMSLGTPVKLTASVFPSNTQGSVGFTVNGAPISASIPISNGTASFTWTPNVAGKITLGASYTTTNGGSGSTSESVTVNAPTSTDVITLVQPGWGPWTNGGSYNMGNGSNFAFQANTLSGAPVTLTETGPCQVTGLTLTVNVGSGACNMKATTPGGNGYAGVTYGYSINLVPGVQTAKVTAPPSGRIKVGRVLVLESPNVIDTNAGQNITWRIKMGGKKHCTLLYPDNGSVTLRVKNKGTCTVIGKAPGIPGQWQAFKTARNYTGR
jgi:hypothetical protein